MQDSDIKVLQASLDDIHEKLCKIYGALMTPASDEGFGRAVKVIEISESWNQSYQKAKADAIGKE